jgi:hypothetical protein
MIRFAAGGRKISGRVSAIGSSSSGNDQLFVRVSVAMSFEKGWVSLNRGHSLMEDTIASRIAALVFYWSLMQVAKESICQLRGGISRYFLHCIGCCCESTFLACGQICAENMHH